MAASFPNSIKQFTTWKNIGDPTEPQGDTVFAFHVNELHDEVFAIETTLGANPQGGAASVAARLAALESGKSSGGHTHPQYMIPIGACFMFPSGAPPGTGLNVLFNASNVFLLCNGAGFSGTTYPDLAAYLGGTTLPDFRNLTPMGAGSTVALGATAGALTQTLGVGQLPSHSHGITDGGHNHGGATGTDSVHHTHAFPATNILTFGAASSLSVVPTAGSPVGSQQTIGIQNLVASFESAEHTHSVASNVTGITVTNTTGSGTPVSILQPVIGVNWYIKALTVP